jgi:phenylacetate-coenzyme A ligase PaaK-like adenylate-forming protein
MSMFDKLYSLPFALKQEKFLTMVLETLEYHFTNCIEYQRIVKGFFTNDKKPSTLEELPFLPVRLFKSLDLKSVKESDVVKTITSSGTSGQGVSKIYLDRVTVKNQQKALVSIFKAQTNHSRMPMLIIDAPSTVNNRLKFNARAAGILGFSMFGSQRDYALNEDLSINIEVVRNFFKKNNDKPFFLFGFTFIVFRDFILSLEKEKIVFENNKGMLIHGGGWKKLEELAVSPDELKIRIKNCLGISSVFDYYGMVEQTGSIFLECSSGYFHCSEWSEILVRNPNTLEVVDNGQEGLLQLISLVPSSYPGNSILTEDLGKIHGTDDCSCGRRGKYFKVHGRITNSELRGCSNVIK